MASLLLGRVEKLLNRHVGESTAALQRLEQLEGRSFEVAVEGLSLNCVLGVRRGRISVSRDATTPPDASVAGTPLDLLGLLASRAPASRLHGAGARLTGKIHVAEGFAEMLRLALPDPEEELASWIGDIAAHELGRAARGTYAWAARATEALRLDTAEYLQEESRALPGPYEIESFMTQVERLRDDVERAAERLDLLAGRARRQ